MLTSWVAPAPPGAGAGVAEAVWVVSAAPPAFFSPPHASNAAVKPVRTAIVFIASLPPPAWIVAVEAIPLATVRQRAHHLVNKFTNIIGGFSLASLATPFQSPGLHLIS